MVTQISLYICRFIFCVCIKTFTGSQCGEINIKNISFLSYSLTMLVKVCKAVSKHIYIHTCKLNKLYLHSVIFSNVNNILWILNTSMIKTLII